MDTQPPPLPPAAQRNRSITYSVDRNDLFIFSATGVLRNRILQAFFLGLLLFNGWRTLAPEIPTRTLLENIGHAVLYLVLFCIIVGFFQVLLSALLAYIPKHRGVIGQHTIELTEQGLIERTECNESLHRWPSIGRIISNRNYLYIYVTSENAHAIPKRGFSSAEIHDFEAEVRARAKAHA